MQASSSSSSSKPTRNIPASVKSTNMNTKDTTQTVQDIDKNAKDTNQYMNDPSKNAQNTSQYREQDQMSKAGKKPTLNQEQGETSRGVRVGSTHKEQAQSSKRVNYTGSHTEGGKLSKNETGSYKEQGQSSKSVKHVDAHTEPETSPKKNDTSSFREQGKVSSRVNEASFRAEQEDDAELTIADIEAWKKSCEADPASAINETLFSLRDSPLKRVAQRGVEIADSETFNLRLSRKVTPVINQKTSTRCWLFAATNSARLAFIKKYDPVEFQFSQAYLFFWDKLEKANFYLENTIDLVNEGLDLDSRMVQHLNQSPATDAGQWDMAANLLEKYGLVPQNAYPDSWHSSNSDKLDDILTSKLREYALKLREVYTSHLTTLEERPSASRTVERPRLQEQSSTSRAKSERVRANALRACRTRKNAQMAGIYAILAMMCGVPPKADEALSVEFYDKKMRYKSLKLTPKKLYESIQNSFDASEYISLIDDPRNYTNKLYTVQRLGNVWGGRPVLFVNTENNILEKTVIKMLKADIPVWIGCDGRQLSTTAHVIMDPGQFDYKATFGTGLSMSKAERLQTGESSLAHAMVIVAAQLDNNGDPVRYQIENSCSPMAAGPSGYYTCTSDWFKKYVYQIVVPKKLAPPKLVQIFERDEIIELPAWDPMGALA